MVEENFKSLKHISPELTNENLSKALSDWFKNDLEFTHWEYVGDRGKGDSHMSEVIRIKIYGKERNGGTRRVQVVLKSIPKSMSCRLTCRSDEFFRNEINFYDHVLPALLEFQATKQATDPFDNYAKVFMSHTDGDSDFICLEDVSIYDFGSATRQVGIDLLHCKYILKTFAKFHALSFAMRDQMPEKFWEIKMKIFEVYYHERLWGWYRKFWKVLCDIGIDAVEKEYPNTIYVDKVKEFATPETYFKAVDAVNRTFDTGVILHGDSWINNFLFKYQNGNPVDAKMIDFQFARCGSPVLDLSFFIYACTDEKLRSNHYDEMLDHYYSILARQISEMGSDSSKVYSKDTFWVEVKKYSFFGLVFSFESTPVLVIASEETFDREMPYVGDTGKGDSHMSEVIRIKIYGKERNGGTRRVQVVLKSIPKSMSCRLTCRSDEFFRNEINFYDHVLPALLEFQATKQVTDPFDNYAKVFMSHTDGESDFICLEDVSIYDFGSATRQVGIDLLHCKYILKTFAKFHALSFAMRDQMPEKFWEIKMKIFEIYYHERLWGWYRKFWKVLCDIGIDAVEKEYPNTIYVDKVKEFATPETYFKAVDAVNRTFDTGVISHGDSWTNNFLFKYQNGNPVDAKMIDFQLARCGSPVLDLSFFIYACTDEKLRSNHYDEMLDYYYSILARQISEMGSDPSKVYSKDTFWVEVKKYSFFGLVFSFESTPVIVLAPEDAFDMEMPGEKKLNIVEIWPLKPFKTKEGRLREANNVVHCVDRGYI